MWRTTAHAMFAARLWLGGCVLAAALTWPSPARADFDIDLAVELGRLSLHAYQMLADFENQVPFSLSDPHELVAQIFTDQPLTTAASVAEAVPIAFVATRDEAVYVVFRGTVTAAESLLGTKIGQVPYTPVPGGGQTEEGFTGVYESIRAAIIQIVQELDATGLYSKLFLTGHSLGGALAALAVPDLATATPFARPTMYSFAGPFVGDFRFSRLYRRSVGESWRVVNTNDVVPKLPPPVTVTRDGVFFYAPLPTRFAITFGQPLTWQNFWLLSRKCHGSGRPAQQ